ncbi:MAG: methylglyoxal synthase [Clostridia bacterium]|nr:methylglyoxal synthase [Clostridia bacterium]
MNIALIAHDNKKELMANFCFAYSGVLSAHKLYATGSTADAIMEYTKMSVESLSPGLLGGLRQLDTKIICGEIDMMIYFTNTLPGSNAYEEEGQLFTHCDIHDVPYATNMATAEILIHGLERGDLDWRDLVRDL